MGSDCIINKHDFSIERSWSLATLYSYLCNVFRLVGERLTL